MPVFGGDKVEKNMNRAIKQLGKDIERGLDAAALFIQAETRKRTPVVTGNLKGSIYTAKGKTIRGFPVAEVGSTASYATAVHENLQPKERKSKVGGPKFLERAVNDNRRKIVEIVAKYARIK